MYRTYLSANLVQLVEGSQTTTADRDAAAQAFAALVDRVDLDGQRMAATLMHKRRCLAVHAFNRSPGHQDYWRGRLDEIRWPRSSDITRAVSIGTSQNDSAGEIPAYVLYPIDPTMRRTADLPAMLDDESLKVAHQLGDGDVGLGVIKLFRAAIRAERPTPFKGPAPSAERMLRTSHRPHANEPAQDKPALNDGSDGDSSRPDGVDAQLGHADIELLDFPAFVLYQVDRSLVLTNDMPHVLDDESMKIARKLGDGDIRSGVIQLAQLAAKALVDKGKGGPK